MDPLSIIISCKVNFYWMNRASLTIANRNLRTVYWFC